MSNLFKRIFSGLVYVSLFVFSTLFSKQSYIIFVSILGLISIWEFSKIIKLKSFASYLFFISTVFLLLKTIEEYAVNIVLSVTIFSSLLLIYQLFSKKEVHFNNKREKFGLIIRYIVFSTSFIVLLPFYDGNYHEYIVICILILIWANDSFAFLIGKNFGKRKLFESISPKKTIEGFLGGLFFSMVISYIISIFNNDFSFLHWLCIAMIISILGTIGDLIESKFKRFAKVKDSGSIMPGHGGILDRLDSLLFVAPFVYLYIKFFIN